MTEEYKTYVFFFSRTSNQATVQSEYDTALENIANDGGTPISQSTFIGQGTAKVSIIYKSSKPN